MAQLPRARREQLIVKELPAELLVYDLDNDRAYCLNNSVALVWKHCDGKTTTGEMARILNRELGAAVDEDVVWLALRELEKSRLLQDAVQKKRMLPSVTRRELVFKYAPAAALVLPAILAISAPTAAHAASCLAVGAGCTFDAECCSGNCNAGTCGAEL
ncbi:MAG TPA: hypothetical protein VF723_01455 [Pyrinomonadaceae bacterium]|jgi:hypothetical protein